MEFDIMKAILDKIDTLKDDAPAFFGKSKTVIQKWSSGTAIPDVFAAQKVLDEALASGELAPPPVEAFSTPPVQGKTIPDPQPKPDLDPRTTEGTDEEKAQPLSLPERPTVRPAKKFSIMCPVHRQMSHGVVLSILGNWKATLPEEYKEHLSNLDFEHDTTVHASRNILATRFLQSGNEWSFWIDSDIIAPIGNPGWFRRRANVGVGEYPDSMLRHAAINRLSSRGKTIVSGVYVERNRGGRVISQPGLFPRNSGDEEINRKVKQGPKDEVVQVGWVPFGCVAVHRKVFLDILERVPDARQKDEKSPHRFFNPIESGPQSEDVAFCKRAEAAGHPSYLDLSIICAHLGNFPFMP